MDASKAKRMLSSLLKSDPNLPCAAATTASLLPSDKADFAMNRENQQSGMQSSYSFLSDNSCLSPMPHSSSSSPLSFSPSPYAMSPWNNTAPSPGALSPWHPHFPMIVDGKSYGCSATMLRQDGHIYALAVSSADGLLYTGSESENIRVWNSPNLNEYGCFKSRSGSVKALVVAGDKVFSAHYDLKIRIWRKGRGTSAGKYIRLATLPTMKDQIRSSVNPKNYVQVRRHRNSLWIKHLDVISSLACNEQEGLLFSGSWDKTVRVWRMSDWKCVESIHAHHDAVNSVAVGPDGLLFTASADCTVKVWRRYNGGHVLVQTLDVQKSAVNGVAVSAYGEFLYAGSADGIVNYWTKEKTSGRMLHAGLLRGHRLAVLCIATVKNVVISGSADKTIRVWRRDYERTLHSCVAVLDGHSGPVKCIAATIDAFNGRVTVCSGSLDRSLKIWWVSENADDCRDESTFDATNPALSPAWVQQRLSNF